MRLTKLLLFAVIFLGLNAPVAFSDPIGSLYAGVNGIWNQGEAAPFTSDLEGALNASASLTPHLSIVGSADYGFSHHYWRGTGGARATATDVDNKDFSVGVGIQYHVSNLEGWGNEWAPDMTVGVRPFPKRFPWLLAGAQAWYGLTTKQAAATLGLRVRFNL